MHFLRVSQNWCCLPTCITNKWLMNLQYASPCLLPLPEGDRECLVLQEMKPKWTNCASLFLFGYLLQSCQKHQLLLQIPLHRNEMGAGRHRQAAHHLCVCSPGCISFYLSWHNVFKASVCYLGRRSFSVPATDVLHNFGQDVSWFL